MRELFFENPLLIGFVGGMLTGISGLVWLNTMHRVALQISCGCLALTAILVLLNLNVITDRERIEQMMYRVADALGKNDLETVFQAIHPAAANTVLLAKTELPRYAFTEARITGISSITVDRNAKPTSAIAQFNVRVVVTIGGDKISGLRFVKIYLKEHDSEWKVVNYEHFEPTAGLRLPTDSASSSPLEALRSSGASK